MELTGVPGIVNRSRNPCSFFAGLNASVYVPLSFERDRRAKRDVVRVVSCRVVVCYATHVLPLKGGVGTAAPSEVAAR